MRSSLLTCCLLLLLGCPPLLAQQATVKPVFVTATAPIDNLLADVDYLTKLFGAEDQGKMVRQFAGPLLGGIDRKRPWGAYVTLDGGQFKAIGFIPVKSLQNQLAILEEQIGKPEQLEGGVLKLALPPGVNDTEEGPGSVFLKEQNGWAFYSDKVENLTALPQNPVALLGGLEKKYDLGARFIVENVAAADRQQFVDQIKAGFQDKSFTPQEGATELPEEWMRSIEDGILRYAEGTKSIDLGLTVDSQQANVALSLAVEPIAGSDLAKSLASVRTLTTPHSGVLVPGSAVVLHRAAKFDQEDIAFWNVFFDQILKETQLGDIPEEKQALAREGLPLLERVLKAGHADGTVDWGMSYLINEEGKLTTLGGSHVAGLKQLEADTRAFLEKHKANEPELAKFKVEWDFAKHGKVRIVKATPPADTPHNSELLGDDPSIYVGIESDYLYMANGHDALKHLKEAIDRSAAKPTFKAAPFRMRVDVRPLTKLAVSSLGGASPAVEQLTHKLEDAKGKTTISVNVLPGEAGLEGRLEVGEGVLRIMPDLGQILMQAFANLSQPMLDAPGQEPGAFDAPAF